MCMCGKYFFILGHHKCPPRPTPSKRDHKLDNKAPTCVTNKGLSLERFKTEPNPMTTLRKHAVYLSLCRMIF